MSKIQKITINNPADFNAEKKLIEAVKILYHLDYWTRRWKESYGKVNRERMVYWQEQAKDFIDTSITVEK